MRRWSSCRVSTSPASPWPAQTRSLKVREDSPAWMAERGGVTRTGHDRLVETEVGSTVLGGCAGGEVLLHTIEECADPGQVVGGGTGGGDGRGGGFDHPADLEDLQQGLVAGDLGQHGEGLQEVGGAQRGDVDARAVPGLQNAEGGQGADRLAHGPAGDPEPGGEFAFGGQTLLWSYLSVGDHRLDLLDGPLGDRGPHAVNHPLLQSLD